MLNTLQILRGLAALAVVFSHLEHWNSLAEGRPNNETLLVIGTYAVSIFFVISGFIIAHSHRREFGRPQSLLSYLVKRAFRIYPAYFALSALGLLISRTNWPNWDRAAWLHRDTVQILAATTLLPVVRAPTCSFLGVGWSLFFEITFYLLFALFFLSKRLGWFTLLFYSVACIANEFLRIDVFWLWKLATLFPLGCVLAELSSRDWFGKLFGKPAFVLGIVLFITGVLVSKHHNAGVVCEGLSALLLVGGSAAMDMPKGPQPRRPCGVVSRFMIWVGAVSYSLYLCHNTVHVVLYRVLGPPASMWTVFVYLVVPLGVASLSYAAIEKTFQRIAKKICTSMSTPIEVARST